MRYSEPATAAFKSIDELKQSLTDLLDQRDIWIKRYEHAMKELAECQSERDYWQSEYQSEYFAAANGGE